MRLPAHILQQIVGHPVAHFSGSGHKRALGRLELQNPATILPIEGDLVGDPIPVTLRDISAETIGMWCPRAMMPFSSFFVSIPMPKGEPMTIRCRVMRCIRAEDEEFALAAQFISLVDAQTLRALTADQG